MQYQDRSVAAQQALPAPSRPSARTLAALGLHTLIAGSLYFVTAYAALTLAAGPDGVALYWPSSGIAVGLVLALGRTFNLPVAIGTLVATVVANIIFGRSPALSFAFGLCNAFEALAVGWLYRLLLARDYPFRRLTLVLALFAAAGAGCAIAAWPAALAISAAGVSDAPLIKLWLTWLLSDFVGIAVVAPLVMAVIDLARSPSRKYDWSLDIVLLLLFGFAAHDSLSVRFDSGAWQTMAPGVTTVPVLIWIAARAQPIVPALAVAVLGIIIEGYTAVGAGRYGDVRVPLEARAFAAQATLAIVSLLTLSISALFAGQRSAEARLRASERRLALIADAAPGVIFTLERSPDGRLMMPFVSRTSVELLGVDAEHLGADPEALLGRLEAGDRRALLDALAEASSERGLIHLELPLRKLEGGEMWLEISARSNREADGSITWHGFIHDVTARRRLVEELNHRTRNLLTVVQAVAEHTARGTPPKELADKLGERLAGLAASHQLLAARGWEGVEIGPLVTSQLAHLESLFGSRLLIEGPSLTLRPQAAQIIGMAVHELATNACKHGALSQQGEVRLSWIAPEDDVSKRFRMTWEESGGPPFADSGRRGFGRKVIVEMATYQLAAEVDLAPRSDGLMWRLSAPRERVVHGRRDTRQ